MKIYTKIIYEWLDGRLVEQSSDFFEYEGDLTLCAGGGGGGGSVPIVEKVTKTTGDFATDPLGTTTEVVSDVGAEISAGADTAAENVQTAVEMGSENLATGLENNQMTEGTATTLSDWRSGMDATMAPVQEELGRWTDATTTNLEYGQDWLMEKAEEITDFVHGPRPEETVTVSKGALKGGVKKKSKSDLAVNKGKQRARQTLRISNTA